MGQKELKSGLLEILLYFFPVMIFFHILCTSPKHLYFIQLYNIFFTFFYNLKYMFIYKLLNKGEYLCLINCCLFLKKASGYILGIEETEEVVKLKKEGCDFFQGYLFARPLKKEDMIKCYNFNYFEHGQ